MRNETNIPFFPLQDMKINKAQKNRAKQDQLSALVHPHISYQVVNFFSPVLLRKGDSNEK
jgi:hypothetical protein